MSSPLRLSPDRSMLVPASHTVRVDRVPVEDILLGCRDRMAVGDIEEAYRRLLQVGDGDAWPPVVGRWTERYGAARFEITDGRHECMAALALGRTAVLACWLEPAEPPAVDKKGPA